jgi:hypothetical protein
VRESNWYGFSIRSRLTRKLPTPDQRPQEEKISKAIQKKIQSGKLWASLLSFLEVHCILLIERILLTISKVLTTKTLHSLSPSTTDRSCTGKEWGARKGPGACGLTLLLDECLRLVREVLLSAISICVEMVLPKLESGLHLGWILILDF